MSTARALWRAGAITGALLAVMAGSALCAHAQAGSWSWESPRPQGNTLRSACTTETGALWAAGEVGTFGSFSALSGPSPSWTPVAVRSTEDLYAIACCPSGVVAVGMRGTLVHVASGAEPQQAREQALGGEPRAALTGVACAGERGVVVASAGGELWVSSDGGARFERRAAPHPLYALHVMDDVVVASGPGGVIARTSDFGRTWTRIKTSASSNLLAFAGDARDLVAVGAGGAALRSQDGGATWTAVATGTRSDLLATERGPGGETLAIAATGQVLSSRGAKPFAKVGSLSDRFHALVRTQTGWAALGVGGRVALRRGSGPFALVSRWQPSLHASFSDGRTRLIVGDRGFIARADGKAAFAPVRTPTKVALHAVTMNAQGVVLVTGAQGTILRSTDRGRSFRAVGLPVKDSFNSVWLDDAGHAVIVGSRGQRHISSDAGRSWTSASLDKEAEFTGITSRGASVWTVGPGLIQRSDDFGQTWISEPTPAPDIDLRTPLATGHGALIVTSRAGAVHRRDPSGAWRSLALHPEAVFTGISAASDLTVLVASDGSTFVSSDDGVSFRAERPLTREVLTSVRAAPDGRMFATGYWGSLLVRTP